MAAGFHFAFELLKTALLAAIYSGFILLAILVYKMLSKRDIILSKVWGILFQSIFVTLFIFSFTYYGDHGLGDDSYIPLGNNETLIQSDEYVYIEHGGKQITVGKFALANSIFCADTDSGYIVYNLKTKTLMHFNNDLSYSNYAANKGLPQIEHFESFYTKYMEYWNGWRFWLLP